MPSVEWRKLPLPNLKKHRMSQFPLELVLLDFTTPLHKNCKLFSEQEKIEKNSKIKNHPNDTNLRTTCFCMYILYLGTHKKII